MQSDALHGETEKSIERREQLFRKYVVIRRSLELTLQQDYSRVLIAGSNTVRGFYLEPPLLDSRDCFVGQIFQPGLFKLTFKFSSKLVRIQQQQRKITLHFLIFLS